MLGKISPRGYHGGVLRLQTTRNDGTCRPLLGGQHLNRKTPPYIVYAAAPRLSKFNQPTATIMVETWKPRKMIDFFRVSNDDQSKEGSNNTPTTRRRGQRPRTYNHPTNVAPDAGRNDVLRLSPTHQHTQKRFQATSTFQWSLSTMRLPTTSRASLLLSPCPNTAHHGAGP